MARLITLGYELNTQGEFDSSSGSQATVQSTTVRSGTYAGKSAPASTAINGWGHQFASAAGTGPFYFRFYMRVHTNPGAATTVAYLHSALISSTATAPVASLQLGTGGTLTLKDGSSTVGSASAALTADTWYRVELKIDGTPSSGSRIIEAQLNGTTFASTSTSTSTLSVDWMGWGANLGNSATTSSGELYFDDIAVNDSTGTKQTGYPGEGHVFYLRPTAVGDSDFTNAFIEGAGSGNANWQHVNETPYDDSTTYLKRDEAAGTATRGDMYKLTDPVSGAGIGSGDTVNLVALCLRGGAGSSSANNARNLIARLKSKSGGTASDGSAIAFNQNTGTTGWATNSLTAPKVALLTSYTDPDTGVAWTVTGTNSLTNIQAGYQTQSTTGNTTNGARVTALWVIVETVHGAISGTGALSGGGTLAATGVSTKFGTSVLSGGGQLTITGTRKVLGTLLLSGGGTLHLAQQGVNTITGTLALSGGGTLAAAGARVISGTLVLTGNGTLALTGIKKVSGTGAFAGGGTFHFDQRLAVTMYEAGGTWSSGSTLRLGGRTWTGTAALTTTGTFAAAGHKVAPHGGFLSLQSAATLTATGKRTVYGIATLSGGGTFHLQALLLPTSERLTLDRDSRLELDHPSKVSANI